MSHEQKTFDLDALLAADSERYQSKELKQHIMDLPDTYIGSKELSTVEKVWIANNDDDLRFIQKDITIPMGLYKIFDEILTNASDNVGRTRSLSEDKSVHLTKTIKVDVAKDGSITIFNDGDGLPVVEHSEHKILIPEMVFGQLLTSGNYQASEEKTWGGKNGYGAKLCSIFSLRFEVETVDHRRKKKFRQVWVDHMSDPLNKAKVSTFSGKPYTKITFLPDYEYFGMSSGLTEDMLNLIRKRTIDIAGWTDRSISVYFNGTKIGIKDFNQYVSLYIGGSSETKRVSEASGDRWEVSACVSPDGNPRQVSFVNGVCTLNGGKHVEYITNQIARKLCDRVNNKGKKSTSKKKVESVIKPQHVKNNLWVFVKAAIVNPSFASQTKEVLTTPYSKFGSKCDLSDDFYKKLEKTEIVARAKLLKGFHDQAGLQKTDGKKVSRIRGLPKLEDASWAGTSKSSQCTLIITEGDSAKAFAVAGLKVVGSQKYGVYPIRGKLLNVRDVSDTRISANTEIQDLKKILGLQHGKVYTSRDQLRYGEIMILTDQDVDGSHIKGLVMNFVEYFWESLLPLDFMVSMYTPIVKIRKKVSGKDTVVETFYNLSEYNEWKKRNPWVKKDNIKYYKGLGTSTSKEAREYFSNLQKITYKYSDLSKDALDLAFNKKRADHRKEWLRHYNENQTLDMKEQSVPIDDFVNRELIHFSHYDNHRSIPSFMDGLKPSQRKVLYGVLTRKQIKEIKLAQLVGPIASLTCYHHGEGSLEETIVGMAQDFIGSNNINLLVPSGQFGTRLRGGKDHAQGRYIFTCLENITRSIFCDDDRPILEHLEDDGVMIEPRWYLPIIPMILVNGSHGIGTGFSTHVPCYSPRDIIAAIRLILDGKLFPSLTPWYRSFTGEVIKHGKKWITRGCMEFQGTNKVVITELPVGVWTDDYREFLHSLEYDSTADSKKKKIQCITSFEKGANYSDDQPHFILNFRSTELKKLKSDNPEKLRSMLKLEEMKSSSVSNLHMFDPLGNMIKFKSVDGILRAFCKIRLAWYVRRKEYKLKNLSRELKMLDAKIRFIEGIIDDTVRIYKKSDTDVLTEIRDNHQFPPNPMKSVICVRPVSVSTYEKAFEGEIFANGSSTDIASSSESSSGSESESESSSESDSESSDSDSSDSEDSDVTLVDEKQVSETKETRDVINILNEDFGYLTGMQIRTLTQKKANDLRAERTKKAEELRVLTSISPKDLWRQDLLNLEKDLTLHEREWLHRRQDDL